MKHAKLCLCQQCVINEIKPLLKNEQCPKCKLHGAVIQKSISKLIIKCKTCDNKLWERNFYVHAIYDIPPSCPHCGASTWKKIENGIAKCGRCKEAIE